MNFLMMTRGSVSILLESTFSKADHFHLAGSTAYVVTPPTSSVGKKKIVPLKIPRTVSKFQISPPKGSIFPAISSSPSFRSVLPSVALRGVPVESVPRSFHHLSPVFSTALPGADSAPPRLSPIRGFRQEDVEKFEEDMARAHPELTAFPHPSRSYSYRQDSPPGRFPSVSGMTF